MVKGWENGNQIIEYILHLQWDMFFFSSISDYFFIEWLGQTRSLEVGVTCYWVYCHHC